MCWFQSVTSSACAVDAIQKKTARVIARTADLLGQNIVSFLSQQREVSIASTWIENPRVGMIGPHPGREIGTFIYGTNIPAMVKEL
jgi:hypothetical protein